MPYRINRRVLPSPDDPNEIVQSISEILRLLDGGVSFGHPQDPASDTSTTLAGGTGAGHNGTLTNLEGSWVEVAVDTAPGTGAAIEVFHNLNLEVPDSTEPNVRWLLFGASHDGTGAAPANANITVWFQEGDSVGSDSIELRVGASGLTVADATPLTLTLFIIPAVRFSAV